MTAPPPTGTTRVVLLLARLAARRFWNRARGMFRRRDGDRGSRRGRRAATPPKGGFAGLILPLFGVFFLFQSLLLCSQLLQKVARGATDSAAASGADELPVRPWSHRNILEAQRRLDALSRDTPSSPVDREAARERVLRWLGQRLRDSETPRTGEGDQRIEAILRVFRDRGAAGFRVDRRLPRLWLDRDTWPDAAAEPALLRQLAVVLLVLFCALVTASLGSANQDLGRVEWSFEWLFSFPVRTPSLLLAKVLEYTLLNPFSWMTSLPLFVTIFWAAGHGGAAIPLAIAATSCFNLCAAGLRVLAETWLRMRLSLSRVKNVQALCSVIGIVLLYAILYLALAKEMPGWLRASAAAMPTALCYSPPALALLLARSGSQPVAVLAALLTASIAVAGLCLAAGSLLLRNGLLRSGSAYRGSRNGIAAARAPSHAFRGILGKEVKLFLRDRNFMVQTAVVPILIIGFQVLINPGWLEAAGDDFRHGAMMAFTMGAYVLMAGGASIITGEGRTLWLLYTFPAGIGEVLRRKVWLWATVAAGYALAIMTLVRSYGDTVGLDVVVNALVVLIGVVIYAFIAGGLGILGANPLSRNIQRKMRPGTVYLYLTLASMFAYGIYDGAWWTKTTMLVLCALLAYAIWQKVGERMPFLLDAGAAAPPRIAVSDGLVASLAFFVVQGVVVAVTMRATQETAPSAGLLTVSFVVAGVTVVLGCLLVFSVKGVPRLGRALGLRRDGPAAPGLGHAVRNGIGLGTLAAALGLAYLYALREVDWFQAHQEQAFLRQLDVGDRLWIYALAVLAAPLFEEFIFRGLLFRGLRMSLSPTAAAVGSAAVFAIVHHPVSWAPVFGLGLAAAVALERTHLLWAPILVHAVYNAAVIGLQW